MSKENELEREQVKENFQQMLPSLMIIFACLGIAGFSSYIATNVQGWSLAYWVSIIVELSAFVTVFVLFSRLMREEKEHEEQEENSK